MTCYETGKAIADKVGACPCEGLWHLMDAWAACAVAAPSPPETWQTPCSNGTAACAVALVAGHDRHNLQNSVSVDLGYGSL